MLQILGCIDPHVDSTVRVGCEVFPNSGQVYGECICNMSLCNSQVPNSTLFSLLSTMPSTAPATPDTSSPATTMTTSGTAAAMDNLPFVSFIVVVLLVPVVLAVCMIVRMKCQSRVRTVAAPAPDPAQPLEVMQPQFSLGERIGEGAYSTVYKGRMNDSEENVVVKVGFNSQ